jgi:hypothetical protein
MRDCLQLELPLPSTDFCQNNNYTPRMRMRQKKEKVEHPALPLYFSGTGLVGYLSTLSNVELMRLFQDKTFDWEVRRHARLKNYYDKRQRNQNREKIINAMYKVHDTEKARENFIMKYAVKHIYMYSDSEMSQLRESLGAVKRA